MVLILDKRPDCATAWLDAASAVDNLPGHTGYNIVQEWPRPPFPVWYPRSNATGCYKIKSLRSVMDQFEIKNS